MDPTFAHPHWILTGILSLIAGLWLFRWARRNDNRAEIAMASTEAALNKLRKPSPGSPRPPAASPKGSTAARFRNSMAQFIGIVGVVMLIAGLVLIVFGIFYPPDATLI